MSQLEVTLAGCASALAVDALIYPLDTLKTRIQSPKPPPQLFRNLYSGIGPVVLATLPSASVFFLTYESARATLSRSSLPMPAHYFLASTTAELASCAVLTPVEVFKTMSQVSSEGSKRLPFLKTIRQLNFAALRRGYVTMAGRNLPFTGIQFPIYESLRRRIELSTPRRTKTWGAALSASVAGSIGAWLTTPIDVIKTRVMLSQGSSQALESVVKQIYQEKGLVGFLRGAGLRAVWAGGGSGVYLGTYETAKQWLKNEL